MAKSGVIVTLGHGGKATLYRGLLKPEDARAIKADAKHKAKGPKAKPEEKGMSQSLVESLTSHRTVALQIRLANSPKIALIAALHALIQSVTTGHVDSPIQINTNRELPRDEGAAKSGEAKAVDARVKTLKNVAPDDTMKLWAWLSKKDQTELLEILVVCAAASLDAIYTVEPDKKQKAVAVLIADALKLDMTKHWEATAASYFDRVSSTQIVAAVTEACGKAEAAKLTGMKKGDMAKAAERLLKGRGWLPAILRGGKGA